MHGKNTDVRKHFGSLTAFQTHSFLEANISGITWTMIAANWLNTHIFILVQVYLSFHFIKLLMHCLETRPPRMIFGFLLRLHDREY